MLQARELGAARTRMDSWGPCGVALLNCWLLDAAEMSIRRCGAAMHLGHDAWRNRRGLSRDARPKSMREGFGADTPQNRALEKASGAKWNVL